MFIQKTLPRGRKTKRFYCFIFFFSSSASQAGKLLQSHADFQPDYFSMTEKPPEEFCLSPDASTSSSSSCSSSSQSHISVDLTQKRGEVVRAGSRKRPSRLCGAQTAIVLKQGGLKKYKTAVISYESATGIENLAVLSGRHFAGSGLVLPLQHRNELEDGG